MHEPGEVLKSDHREIRRLLSALDGMATSIRKDDSLPDEHLEKAFAVVVEFADKCHHEKEEKSLFPALSKASPKSGAELTRRLTSDHRAFRNLVGNMLELISNATVKKEARTVLAKQISTYTRLIEEHMRVEEETLIPEVKRSIGRDDRSRIAEEFERFEEEIIGPDAHHKYIEIIGELHGQYGTKR